MRDSTLYIVSTLLLITIFTFGYPANSIAEDKWDVSVAPYMWFSALSGDATVKGNSSEVDASFSDLWNSLEFAASVHFEAYYKPSRFGLLADGLYMKLEDDATVNPLGGPIGVNAELELEFLVLDEGIFYRLIERGASANNSKSKPRFTLDGLLFGRLWHVEQNIDFKGEGPIGIGASIDGDKTWFDFNLGLRSSVNLTDKLRTVLRTDFGGFGLGFSSDFSWTGQGALGYTITDNVEALIGYRALYVKYDDGSGADEFELDVWFANPFIAFNFTF